MEKIKKDEKLLENILDVMRQLKTGDEEIRKEFYEEFLAVKEQLRWNSAKEIAQAIINFARYGEVSGPVEGVEPFNW